ncbi:MAG: (4Fe-4S)-binding protein [Deltaproteobacteria bacterium HGW-Deltaproteobacteria-12]|jgi:uncharacterized protein (DUF362 family)/Pyruvate/2-oxoacid:ferredoxin oxidoreductase delta subunit|nr:MAG: (4Fe-4S)-binding protein [Deltaproteobacteria bacterium HGW-Deltaproteobacteria-12]
MRRYILPACRTYYSCAANGQRDISDLILYKKLLLGEKNMANVIVRNATYQYDLLRPIFFEMIEKLAGDKIKPGSRVLIKPNMLSSAHPEDAVLTHPQVLRAAVEYVLEKGARAQVSDSPAIGSFEKILKQNGAKDALQGLDVICAPFQDAVEVDIGKPYGRIEVARDAVEADVIINLPKLKTHSQMLLTLAAKNMFGCIIGFKKSQWHMRAGTDTMFFASLLVAIHQAVQPTVSILDGILALEGEGPGKRGIPRKIGVLMGSDNSFALDMAVCAMIGVPQSKMPMLKVAGDRQLLPEVEIEGTMPRVENFQLPETGQPIFGPAFLQNFLRRHTLARPVCDQPLCKLCGKCRTICPAGAIDEKEASIEFDYGKCIRCYCCLEVCPYAALHSRETLGGRLTRTIINKFS